MNIEKIDFKATDGLELSGLLYKGSVQTKEVILAIHGMTSNCFKKRDELIAKAATENGINYFVFNNRGSDLAKYFKKDNQKILIGTSYEDVYESCYDIEGAVNMLLANGYEKINLQGHSLGATKVVYSYNKIKDKINSVILLSLVDIHHLICNYTANFQKNLLLAEQLEREGKAYALMPKEAFIHPVSVKTYLMYTKNYKDIDFARYHDKEYDFNVLNNIEVPLFMRWGNNNEMVEQNLDDLVNMIKSKLTKTDIDISYIDGADHGYGEHEEELAKQIVSFVQGC